MRRNKIPIHPMAYLYTSDVGYVAGCGVRRLGEVVKRHKLAVSCNSAHIKRRPGEHRVWCEADAVAVAIFESAVRAGYSGSEARRLTAPTLALIERNRDSTASQLAGMFRGLSIVGPGPAPPAGTRIIVSDICTAVALRLANLEKIRREAA